MPLIEIKTGTITEKGQIVIPKSLRKRFSPGEKVAIISYEDRIELRPISSVNEALSCAYATEKTLKKDWDSKEEDEAWKNL
ncbi:MAG: AbrB/MazE/SpoVT family DNA-binding domain-containing protein [Methanomicrobiaceae archaeon]|nr:AbrB/MazE/SpoVT family DNA-binding domain-containing protein [Methanomicrobiaceae archaeon]